MTPSEELYRACCGNGDLDTVKRLVGEGLDVNLEINRGYPYSLLHAAVAYNALEIVNFLVSNGANVNLVNQYGDTPLDIAERNSYDAITQLLKDHKEKTDVNP